jgi:sialate O-acetylesterase
VTVRLDDQEAVATAIDGKWRVVLPAHKEGGPFVMTISGENTITATNVMIGEVWVCSGQSNMEFHLGTKSFGGDADRETEVPRAEHPGLRMFNVERKTGAAPKEEVSGKWMVCSPSTVDAFSAVGYYFGRDILKATGVPVGMIHSSWGGTAAETWTLPQGAMPKSFSSRSFNSRPLKQISSPIVSIILFCISAAAASTCRPRTPSPPAPLR